MKANFQTLLTKEAIGFDANSSKVFNQIFGADFDENFTVKSIKTHEFNIPESDKNSFSFDLSSVVPDFDKLSAVLIFCNNVLVSPEDLPESVRFQIDLDGNPFVQCAQYSMVNIKDPMFTEMTISTFDIATGKSAMLTVVVVLK